MNHFPQNLKKRYRFSLAIVVPQSGSHLHAGDKLFEWPKLSGKKRQMKALTAKFAIAHLHKYAFCDVHKYFIIVLDWRVLFVSFLPFNDYSTIPTIYKTLFQCKTDEKVSCSGRTKIFKTQFVPRTVSLENYWVHWVVFTGTVKNLAFICIADDRPILSLVYPMK